MGEWDAAGVEQMDAEELCERSEMTRRSCVHCRDAGLYTPPQGSGTSALSTRGTEYVADTTEIVFEDVMKSFSERGMKFVGVDEGLLRGKFGKGGADRQDNR